jgi:uncharacterized membrane-anchored protein
MIQLPKLNTYYWMMMLLCTTMGELIGNLLSRNFELGYTQGAVLDLLVFAAMIAALLVFRIQNQIFYWVLILMGNIGGTNLADWVTLDPLASDKAWGIFQPLQLGTKVGSLVVLASLVLILIARTVVIHKKLKAPMIVAILYWMAILMSSTFGTTSGDFITNDTPLGALWGSIALMALLTVVWMATKIKKLNPIAAYWIALVLMHPVGATLGNWISKPIGLNLGNINTNLVMIILFLGLYWTNQRDLKSESKNNELSSIG